jgi:hypothetical protein
VSLEDISDDEPDEYSLDVESVDSEWKEFNLKTTLSNKTTTRRRKWRRHLQ